MNAKREYVCKKCYGGFPCTVSIEYNAAHEPKELNRTRCVLELGKTADFEEVEFKETDNKLVSRISCLEHQVYELQKAICKQ